MLLTQCVKLINKNYVFSLHNKIQLDTILLVWRLTLKQFISENVYNLF